MSEGIEKLIRPELKSFAGYSARKSPDALGGKVEVPVENIIKLDANENLYGCSRRVNEALAAHNDFNIYPDDKQLRLRETLAKLSGVGPEYIVGGSGSNQLIDLILRLFLSLGDEVINCSPTFGVYKFSTDLCGGKLIDIPRDANFAIDVKKLKAAVTKKTKIICLANPNNPTGTVTPQADILEIINTGVPVMVDEAYYEFCGQTVAPLVPQYPNLMVLRTFSKWMGLAGLRVGYGMFPPKIAEILLTIKIPYNVNVAAQVAVEASLKDMDYLMGTVKAMIAERDKLFAELKKVQWLKPYPSQANFILCRVLKGDAVVLQQKLEQKGILVRYFEQAALKDCIRVSIGKQEHTVAFLKALHEIEKTLF